MFSRIGRNSKRIIAVLSQNRKPSQIAWGVAIGVMIGLIPKDNLVAVSLLAMVAFLRVNQLIACCTAMAVHGLCGLFVSTTNFVGTFLLGQSWIAGGIVFLYQFPMLPWTCLENALVLGGLGIGMISLLPSYALCLWSFSKANRQLEHIALEQVVDNAIQYRKSVAEQSKTRQDKPLPALKLLTQNDKIADVNLPAEQNSLPESADKILANEKPGDNGRARRTERKIQQRLMPTIFTGDSHWDGKDTLLRETVIEVVRYRHPSPAEKLPNNSSHPSSAVSSTQGISMPAGNTATILSKDKDTNVTSSATNVPQTNSSLSFDSGHAPHSNNGRDESLRYLLWHINGTRETVRKSAEKTA